VAEIPDELLDIGATREPSKPAEPEEYSEIDDGDYCQGYPEPSAPAPTQSSSRYTPGSRVVHATFGEGHVLSTDGSGKGEKLTVQFPMVGKKVIVARFVEPA